MALVNVKGLKAVTRSLESFGVATADLKEVMSEAGEVVVDEAKRLAPKRSGALAGSIRAGKSKNKVIVRAGKSSIPYANAIHWGTGPRPGKRGPHNISRNAFVWDAGNNKRGEVITTVEHGLDRVIDRYNLN